MAIGEDDQVVDVLGGKWRGTDLSKPQVARWAYQVDQDFFGTEALYGVVGLFLWGRIVKKEYEEVRKGQ